MLSALGRAGRGLAGGAVALAISGATNAVVQLLVPLQLDRAGASTETIGLFGVVLLSQLVGMVLDHYEQLAPEWKRLLPMRRVYAVDRNLADDGS